MRLASCIAAAALVAASPAFATGTILCRSTVSPGDGPALALGVGHGEVSGVIHASLTQGGRPFTTGAGPGAPVIAQSWIDRHSLRLDVVDANAETRILRLDTRRRGNDYLGILILDGRTWRVRCEEAG